MVINGKDAYTRADVGALRVLSPFVFGNHWRAEESNGFTAPHCLII